MVKRYVPDTGEIVWINSTPQASHGQAGQRPALVLSPSAYNRKTDLMICCPLTTQIKNYPFEVYIGGAPPNAVLADQVKSVDWRKRAARPTGRVSPDQVTEVRAKIHALIGQSHIPEWLRAQGRVV
jgi:mRNA interferase MazF